MKTIFRIITILAFLVVPAMTFASISKPVKSGDTIPLNLDTVLADTRQPHYYYTKWLDECPGYYPNGGVVDSCFCRFYEYHCFYGSPVAKWEHTNHRMRIKGLVAMVDRYTPPTDDNESINLKLPEYLYIYQLTGRHYQFLERLGIEDGLELELLDSVRWDTATARVMELKRGWNGEYNQYCYLYEAYFENPVYVDSDFYIFGSTNSNVHATPATYLYVPTVYVDIMDFHDYALNNKDSACSLEPYMDIVIQECKPQGGWVGVMEPGNPALGWYTPWPDSPWGYYLAIVDQWNLDAVPNDTAFGEVLGGGRWPDDSYDTIEAVPALGYYFVSWNDGVTDNPRVIHLTSDTSFVAVFYSTALYDLSVSSSDEAQGTVTGGGTYHEGFDITITAVPSHGYKFSHWNDGVTDNPRVVHLVSDTAFVAYFVERGYYTVETASNNEEWGTVDGGGVYMEGDEASLTVTVEPFCRFEGWSDGDMNQPRTITVTQDTLFTALFSFDSASAASIIMAGDLAFTVSPNPTTGHLAIRLNQSESCDLTVYDMQGKTLLNRKCDDEAVDLDLGAVPAGKYLLMVRTKERYGIRIVVKK